MSSSRPHRCDEFPAEYSLASCSPAELASASSASLMLQPTTPFVEQISANGNRGTFPLSQLKGSPQSAMPPQGVLPRITELQEPMCRPDARWKAAPRKFAAQQTVILNERRSRE